MNVERNIMNINIKATNTTLTPAIKATVTDKLSVLEKFLKEEDVVYLELAEDTRHQSGEYFRVDIQISPHSYYAEARANDFYEAIDLAIPKITEQLRRTKDKRISLRRRFGSMMKKIGWK